MTCATIVRTSAHETVMHFLMEECRGRWVSLLAVKGSVTLRMGLGFPSGTEIVDLVADLVALGDAEHDCRVGYVRAAA